ncbi:hypothetical protein HPP92_003217 [Vanilla planifolia]|uniref:Uncharacterized protein n=1 Tax=Vanilla planifolia TaxID=51239 RepID=A0A835S9Y3_VANPL|nr:hypothetical protein HPP92_003217 [Vanilla planifolia]
MLLRMTPPVHRPFKLNAATEQQAVHLDIHRFHRLMACIPLSPRCSKDNFRSKENGKNERGDRTPVDWDKAWSSFRKQEKRSLFSRLKLDKYVSWNPRRSEYPLSEELDPIKRAERSNLSPWTSPRFTLIGAIVVVLFLLIYTLQFPLK